MKHLLKGISNMRCHTIGNSQHTCGKGWTIIFFKPQRGRLGVPFIHLFVYICWSSRTVALMLCYHSIAPSTCKGDISASAICHLQRFSLLNWCIGRPTQVSSCCFGGLSCNSSFYFATSQVVNDSEVVDCIHELTLLIL